jgi:hypothetical protein
MKSTTTPSRKRIRFGLRLLFLLMLVLGMGFGWIGMQFQWMHRRQEALRWIVPLRERQLASSRGDPVPPNKGFYLQKGGVNAPWNLAIFGEHGVERIEVEQRWFVSDSPFDLDDLRSLFPEAEVMVETSSTPPDGVQTTAGEHPIIKTSEHD